jgi:hypothetical protein
MILKYIMICDRTHRRVSLSGKKQKEKWTFFDFWVSFKVSERSGGEVHSDPAPDSEGFSSLYTLLKYYTFKHLTGQCESDFDYIYEQDQIIRVMHDMILFS